MKKILIAVGILLFIIIAAGIGFNIYLKKTVKKALDDNLSEDLELTYDDLSINSWLGNIMLDNVNIRHTTHDSLPPNVYKIKQIDLNGLSYWDYLKNDIVHFNKIEVDGEGFTLRKNPKTKKKNIPSKTDSTKTKKKIAIDKLIINPTPITILQQGPDSIYLKATNYSLQIDDIAPLAQEEKPFSYTLKTLQADSVYLDLGTYEYLSAAHLEYDEKNLDLSTFSIQSKYSRNQLSRVLKKEHDHIDVTIPEVNIQDLDWQINKKKTQVTANMINLVKPQVNIYRDKLLPDDFTRKKMYSEMLRNLPFELLINTTKIENASITYGEKVKPGEPPGTIFFDGFYATITALGNHYPQDIKHTQIDITSTFMKEGKIEVNWSFNVHNTADAFTFDAHVSNLPVDNLNSFTMPNMRATLEGKMNDAYFDIDGNDNASQVKSRLKYDDFKVTLVNEEKKKKWLLSAIANIFVKKDSQENQDQDYREGGGKVTRNTTKSVFNYIWLNIFEALKNTLIGGGKDKDD
ncbi:MAG: hypothetical protein CL868_14160 [Cytophagaceae bacterium]|nr:hypothetical protein [Cytophagaceae bacterium]|tara:strand:- start:1573 stop:3126 length:1554 start_codon:yes stop_codon:yes gene_type:complete